MNIVHIISGLDPRYGGSTAAVAGLARAQHLRGLRIHVISSFRSGDSTSVADTLQRNGVKVTMVGPTVGRLCRHPAISEAVRRATDDADVVHIHALWEEIQHRAARAASATGVPYIFTPHGMLDPWALRQRRWRKKLYMAWRLRSDLNKAACIHFTAEIERDRTNTLHLHPPSLTEANGIDLREFADLPEKGRFRQKYDIPADRPVVLFLSRLHPKKGLDVLIPAFAAISSAGATLVVAGPDDDGYSAAVQKLIVKHQLQRRVLLPGMLKGRDRIEALVDADLFVLTSYAENFGIVVVEALAAGTPVVISDQVNIHQEITAARVGGVVPLSISATASEIDRWLENGEMRQAASLRGRDFALRTYDWDSIASNWVIYYQRVAQRQSVSKPIVNEASGKQPDVVAQKSPQVRQETTAER
jgi:glycosyltransferase involved in cell wall biosynthesis